MAAGAKLADNLFETHKGSYYDIREQLFAVWCVAFTVYWILWFTLDFVLLGTQAEFYVKKTTA